ncbi:YciI family protein [Amycolatopsis sp., V23-08]|uniref:YciI family protein n=1 Tax=Amycolatopsis heterodermiae TaxID=3110235 RepID=A0ABU5R0G1_9PSEU|nr:YciI family protein [Amycolatopsis sp., V23-08]MEA5359657.1 YciI family protein [Amycolatopsis sp., V23-08]
MPQYAAIIYASDVDPTRPEATEMMQDYNEFGAAAEAVIRGGAALYPTATATTVRVTGGKGGDIVTTDGPYAETKEALTGFYLIECADLDEAVKVAAQIPGAWDGAIEVRPVVEFGK